MRQSGHYHFKKHLSKTKLMELIENAIDKVNIDHARTEVIPFVNDIRTLEIWSKEFFRAAAARIEVIGND